MYDVIQYQCPVSMVWPCSILHKSQPVLHISVSAHWLFLRFIICTPLSNCFAKHCRDVWLGLVIFHPQFDTLSPSCKSRTSLGTMGSGTAELLGLLKGGSPFIWRHYNSTKACGCLHTEQTQDEWAALTLHTCTDKSTGSAKGKPCHVWSPWTNWDKYRHNITKQHYQHFIPTYSIYRSPLSPSYFISLVKFLKISSWLGKLSGFPFLHSHDMWKGLIILVEKAPRQCWGLKLVVFKTSLDF